MHLMEERISLFHWEIFNTFIVFDLQAVSDLGASRVDFLLQKHHTFEVRGYSYSENSFVGFSCWDLLKIDVERLRENAG